MTRIAGFTLVEMLVTLTMLAILAGTIMPFAYLQHRHSQETELKASLRQIRDALDAYHNAAIQGNVSVAEGGSGYPPNLSVLVNGVQDAQRPGAVLYFLRRIPRDPMSSQPDARPEETWGYRSYASPPQAPAPGEDVYDVYSLSKDVGSNGTPYSQW